MNGLPLPAVVLCYCSVTILARPAYDFIDEASVETPIIRPLPSPLGATTLLNTTFEDLTSSFDFSDSDEKDFRTPSGGGIAPETNKSVLFNKTYHLPPSAGNFTPQSPRYFGLTTVCNYHSADWQLILKQMVQWCQYYVSFDTPYQGHVCKDAHALKTYLKGLQGGVDWSCVQVVNGDAMRLFLPSESIEGATVKQWTDYQLILCSNLVQACAKDVYDEKVEMLKLQTQYDLDRGDSKAYDDEHAWTRSNFGGQTDPTGFAVSSTELADDVLNSIENGSNYTSTTAAPIKDEYRTFDVGGGSQFVRNYHKRDEQDSRAPDDAMGEEGMPWVKAGARGRAFFPSHRANDMVVVNQLRVDDGTGHSRTYKVNDVFASQQKTTKYACTNGASISHYLVSFVILLVII